MSDTPVIQCSVYKVIGNKSNHDVSWYPTTAAMDFDDLDEEISKRVQEGEVMLALG